MYNALDPYARRSRPSRSVRLHVADVREAERLKATLIKE
jgi:hypothetical protein